MKLLVGLGNPGAQYARNRHNIGFMAVDAIAGAHGFGPWRAKFSSEVAEGRVGAAKVVALKPQTYMNLSGDAVQAAAAFWKVTPGNIIVFHDELDLEPGKVRVKTGGGHAGHNGLRSIMGHLGPDFMRVRLGIGHPGDKALVTPHVLGDFARAEADWLDDLLRGVARGAPSLVAGNAPGFLSEIAGPRAPRPPKPRGDAAPAPAASPAPAPDREQADARSPLQRLADRFR